MKNTKAHAGCLRSLPKCIWLLVKTHASGGRGGTKKKGKEQGTTQAKAKLELLAKTGEETHN